jgi:hypothetical protein
MKSSGIPVQKNKALEIFIGRSSPEPPVSFSGKKSYVKTGPPGTAGLSAIH